MHVYEVRPRKDKRGVDLISDALPFRIAPGSFLIATQMTRRRALLISSAMISQGFI